ncbi:MAG: UDP-N-acetylglucosamine 2-epimerase (non-hydrolyzing), partial [Acidobacteria bacterium]|nr:UDP-N-acetylglucosamine 2-epimerase (non-hydrolyzing) [Acidobacteriota bacterium]
MTNKKIKLAVVFGTRPEAIKLAPVIQQLSHDPQFQVVSIVTAQHRQMLDQVLNAFRIRPQHDLGIMTPNQTLAGIVSQSVEALDRLFKRVQPGGVLVQGDTATTFVASLAAFYNRISVGHVEAGLRTGDRGQPFPEEMNRKLTSALADWHFAPTPSARENLLAEGVDPATIFVTGNTVIDAFQMALAARRNGQGISVPQELASKRLILVTMHRRENQGAPMRSICLGLRDIVKRFADVAVVLPLHLSPSVRSVVQPLLSGVERVWLTEPLDYLDTARMIQLSTLVITDSGGIQEEAPSLGKPVLVLRNKTERPEGVRAGTAQLVGTSRATIFKAAARLLSDARHYETMASAVNPYGDG